MSMSVWDTDYREIYDSLSGNERRFLERHVRHLDDGTYRLSRGYFSDIKRRHSRDREMSRLISALDRYFASTDGNLTFRIF
jgi:Asp-tRNA(Asn)/Glu-tRNA(Gln) amidotransferase A subunit family amidase